MFESMMSSVLCEHQIPAPPMLPAVVRKPFSIEIRTMVTADSASMLKTRRLSCPSTMVGFFALSEPTIVMLLPTIETTVAPLPMNRPPATRTTPPSGARSTAS